MRDYPEDESQSMNRDFSTMNVGEMIRHTTSVLGMIVLVIGLFFAVRTFLGIYGALSEPALLEESLAEWERIVRADEMNIRIGEEVYPMGRTFCISIVSGGAIMLAWLSLGIMMAGAKIISWTTSDKEAIKKILKHAIPNRNV